MYAFEIPGQRFSAPPGGAVARCRFVSINSNGAGVQATASAPVVGVSMNRIDAVDGTVNPANQVLEIADGIVMVEAAGAIVAGTKVASDANGKATTASAGSGVAVALTAASTAGELITVKL